jgi:hypothetical protein
MQLVINGTQEEYENITDLLNEKKTKPHTNRYYYTSV